MNQNQWTQNGTKEADVLMTFTFNSGSGAMAHATAVVKNTFLHIAEAKEEDGHMYNSRSDPCLLPLAYGHSEQEGSIHSPGQSHLGKKLTRCGVSPEVPKQGFPQGPAAMKVEHRNSSVRSELRRIPQVNAKMMYLDGKTAKEKGHTSQVDATWLSVGSLAHQDMQCKPCVFFAKQLCNKGVQCSHCHFPHPEVMNKRLRPSKKTRRRLAKQEAEALNEQPALSRKSETEAP